MGHGQRTLESVSTRLRKFLKRHYLVAVNTKFMAGMTFCSNAGVSARVRGVERCKRDNPRRWSLAPGGGVFIYAQGAWV